MKKKEKAFTLIELLAIIVILAIIAVITVPIILNIIDNSKKGAATDSAYGYKDAINKFYVSKLAQDKDYIIPNKTYTTTELKNLGVSIEGKEPSNNSWVTIEKNDITIGCLQYDDYAITFKDGKIEKTEKNECTQSIPTIETCPGCVFVYPNENLTIGISTVPEEATNDYTTLTPTHTFFLGLIANPDTKVIERGFACSIEGTTPFCLEGTTDGSNYSDNLDILNTIYPKCNADVSSTDVECKGSSSSGSAFFTGDVYACGSDCCTVDRNDGVNSLGYCN